MYYILNIYAYAIKLVNNISKYFSKLNELALLTMHKIILIRFRKSGKARLILIT